MVKNRDKRVSFCKFRFTAKLNLQIKKKKKNSHLQYTGGIPQRLDTDVDSAMAAKTSTALWQQW